MVIARPSVFEKRLERFGLRMKPGVDIELINPENDPRFRDYWQEYLRIAQRKGRQPAARQDRDAPPPDADRRDDGAQRGTRTPMICGTYGTHDMHLKYIDQVLGLRKGAHEYAAMNGLMLPGRLLFLVDTHVNYDPTAEQIAEITVMAAEKLQRFGIEPKVALLSHSNFGTSNTPSAVKMRDALEIIRKRAPEARS